MNDLKDGDEYDDKEIDKTYINVDRHTNDDGCEGYCLRRRSLRFVMEACPFRTRIVLSGMMVVITECEILLTRNSLTANVMIYKLTINWVHG